MKVIDLILNYYQNKQLPKEIMVNGFKFRYDGFLTYVHEGYGRDSCLFTEDYEWVDWLNDEVEIIEEKIEKLDIKVHDEKTGNCYIENEYGTKCYLTKHSKILADKINEIIDHINKEDK